MSKIYTVKIKIKNHGTYDIHWFDNLNEALDFFKKSDGEGKEVYLDNIQDCE